MTTFTQAVQNQEARTQNGMKARASTADPLVDLFYHVGAMRGKDPSGIFGAAFATERELSLRTALWVRDVRGGAGERETFRKLLRYVCERDVDAALSILPKVPMVGRWDDLLTVIDTSDVIKKHVFSMIRKALYAKEGLCAKWMPRKGPIANELRNFLGFTPKQYRKTLVELTKVVEQQMCAKDWENINYSHVPSVAAKRYRKAFYRHDEGRYKEYVEGLKTGVTKSGEKVKINASAIFPHDVIRDYMQRRFGYFGVGRSIPTANQIQVMEAQWAALPNYVKDGSILPLVDVSGSMTSQVDKSGLTALAVAVSLGLYCADKNLGKFKDTFLTFSGSPQLLHLKGSITAKIDQMVSSSWAMNTNLHAAFKKILDVATKGNVPQEEMPGTLLILSDMQFDQCVHYDDSAIEMIRRKYEQAGYEMPKVVFWNINSYANAPAEANTKDVALVSGFSPSIVGTILSNDVEQFTPRGIMMKKIMSDRYAPVEVTNSERIVYFKA